MVGRGVRASIGRAMVVVLLVVAVVAGPVAGSVLPAAAQITDLTGVWDVTEADSADIITVELRQRGGWVEGIFQRGAVSGTLSGASALPKFVGTWEAEDGSRGSFDLDISPNAPRLEGVWRFEAPAPSLRRQIWMQRLGSTPPPPGAPERPVPPGSRAAAGGAAPTPEPAAPAPTSVSGGTPGAEAGGAVAVQGGVRPGPVFAVGANLGIALALAMHGAEAAEVRSRLMLARRAAGGSGLAFDPMLLDVALQTLDASPTSSAAAPAIQAALTVYQQVADAAGQ